MVLVLPVRVLCQSDIPGAQKNKKKNKGFSDWESDYAKDDILLIIWINKY